MTPSEVIRLAKLAGFIDRAAFNHAEELAVLISLAKAEALAEGWQPIEKDGKNK